MNTRSSGSLACLKTWVALGTLAGAGAVQADVFLDLSSVSPGSGGVGSFSGTLGGVVVTGSILSGGVPVFFFNATGSGVDSSTTDGSTPQFSHASVFSPTVSATDRVGFTYLGMAGNLVTLTFSAPVTDPVFHVANLDWAAFSFLPTPGFTSLTLLNGNAGPEPDGIDPAFGGPAYSNALLWDQNPSTTDATLPSGLPPTSGARSAYASVRINGSFSSLNFMTDSMGPFTDGGSFTISVVPEPSSAMLLGLGIVVMLGALRLRRPPTSQQWSSPPGTKNLG